MTTRFVDTQTSQTGAINAVADMVVQATQKAYTTRTDGAVTLTPAQFINGIVNQGGTAGAFNMTTPTAAAIVAAIENAQAGSGFEFTLINGGSGAVTIVAGTGVTLAGTTAVPNGFTQIYRGIVTDTKAGEEAVTLIGLLHANQLKDEVTS